MNNYLPERPIEPPTEKPDYVCEFRIVRPIAVCRSWTEQ